MATAKVSSKYRIVIPKEVRVRANIKVGQVMYVYVLDEGSILLAPRKKWPDDYIGSEKEFWSKIDVNQFIENERVAWD